jgi:hypothetical protein
MHDYGTSEIKLELIIIEDESIHSDIINNLTGIKLNLNKLDRNIILNLIEYYLIFNNYYISNDNIYQKLKEFNISYELVGTVMDILYKGFKENVIPFFINNFSNYFESFDFQYLLMNHLMNSKYIIRDIIELTTNKIKLDFSLMEFTDGIYSISLNTFIPLKNIKDKVINKATVKFYRKSYRHTRRERPEL